MFDLFNTNETLGFLNTYSVIDDLNSNGVLSDLPEYTINSAIFSEPIPPGPIPPGPIPCFLQGTKILTDKGERLIENLTKGVNLISHKGEKIKLLDIYSFKSQKNIKTHPCLIKKNNLIHGYKCNNDLYISQDHAILIDNQFITISKLIIPREIEDNKDHYVYYHLITENYFTDVIMANGIPSETYGKDIKYSMNRNVYSYLKKHTTKNGNRILLEKNDFINLIKKYLTIQRIRQQKLIL
jgi:hypothetical protein